MLSAAARRRVALGLLTVFAGLVVYKVVTAADPISEMQRLLDLEARVELQAQQTYAGVSNQFLVLSLLVLAFASEPLAAFTRLIIRIIGRAFGIADADAGSEPAAPPASLPAKIFCLTTTWVVSVVLVNVI